MLSPFPLSSNFYFLPLPQFLKKCAGGSHLFPLKYFKIHWFYSLFWAQYFQLHPYNWYLRSHSVKMDRDMSIYLYHHFHPREDGHKTPSGKAFSFSHLVVTRRCINDEFSPSTYTFLSRISSFGKISPVHHRRTRIQIRRACTRVSWLTLPVSKS